MFLQGTPSAIKGKSKLWFLQRPLYAEVPAGLDQAGLEAAAAGFARWLLARRPAGASIPAAFYRCAGPLDAVADLSEMPDPTSPLQVMWETDAAPMFKGEVAARTDTALLTESARIARETLAHSGADQMFFAVEQAKRPSTARILLPHHRLTVVVVAPEGRTVPEFTMAAEEQARAELAALDAAMAEKSAPGPKTCEECAGEECAEEGADGPAAEERAIVQRRAYCWGQMRKPLNVANVRTAVALAYFSPEPDGVQLLGLDTFPLDRAIRATAAVSGLGQALDAAAASWDTFLDGQ